MFKPFAKIIHFKITPLRVIVKAVFGTLYMLSVCYSIHRESCNKITEYYFIR